MKNRRILWLFLWALLLAAGCGTAGEEAPGPAETEEIAYTSFAELLPQLYDQETEVCVHGQQAYGWRVSGAEDAFRVNTLGGSRTLSNYTLLGLSEEQKAELGRLCGEMDLGAYEQMAYDDAGESPWAWESNVRFLLLRGDRCEALLHFYFGPAEDGSPQVLFQLRFSDGRSLFFQGAAFEGYEQVAAWKDTLAFDHAVHPENVVVTVFSAPEGSRFTGDGVPKLSNRGTAQYLLSYLEWELREEEPLPAGEPSRYDAVVVLCSGEKTYWLDLERRRIMTVAEGEVRTVAVEEADWSPILLYLEWSAVPLEEAGA